MINKNFFVGPLGKLQHIGGSKAFTTPNTIAVQKDYSVKVNDNIQGDLVVHSLNGRLWFFRKNSILANIALKWNSRTSKLEFAASSKVKGFSDTFIANGKDWIISNNNIFMVTDEEPYIFAAKLLADNIPDTFLYSVLRANGVGSSAIDTFTNQAWGKREDNGNSDGLGLFSKNNHFLYPKGTHTFERCYSFLPAVGDWQIFENFLIRRPDNPLNKAYNFMLNLRPLIPLEFVGDTPAYGTGYNFDHRGIQLAYSNGQIWARGLHHIGKVSLLPAVFDENGEPVEFYLYISPDFPLVGDLFFAKCFNGHTFKLINIPGTWSHAKSYCESIGGHLATSTSEEKNNFLATLTDKTVWIGGTDENSEGSWRWINGEAWNYSNWTSGNPDNDRGEEHYLEINWGGTGLWNDNKGYATREGFICEWDSSFENPINASFLDLGLLLGNNSNVAGILTEQSDTLSSCFCSKASLPVLFNPENISWLPLQQLYDSELPDFSNLQGALWLDAVSSEAFYLHDEGAALLSGTDEQNMRVFKCNTLNQWLAPAGSVSAVSRDFVLAETDNSILLTAFASGFNRQILPKCSMPLSWTIPSGNDDNNAFRMAIEPVSASGKIKSFDVHSLNVRKDNDNAINWQDIYKKPINISLLNIFKYDLDESVPIFVIEDKGGYFSGHDEIRSYHVPLFIKEFSGYFSTVRTRYETYHSTANDGTVYTERLPAEEYLSDLEETWPGFPEFYAAEKNAGHGINAYVIIRKWSGTLFYIDPENGTPHDLPFSFSLPHVLVQKTSTYNYDGRTFSFTGFDFEESIFYIGVDFGIYDNKIGICCSKKVCGRFVDEESYHFFPIMEVPAAIKNYIPDGSIHNQVSKGSLYLKAFRAPSYMDKIYQELIYQRDYRPTQFIYNNQSVKSPFIAEFRENFSNSSVFCNLPSSFSLDEKYLNRTYYRFPYRDFFDWSTLDSNNDNSYPLKAFHVIILDESSFEYISDDDWHETEIFLVFKSEINPNIFDFHSEVERSLPY